MAAASHSVMLAIRADLAGHSLLPSTPYKNKPAHTTARSDARACAQRHRTHGVALSTRGAHATRTTTNKAHAKPVCAHTNTHTHTRSGAHTHKPAKKQAGRHAGTQAQARTAIRTSHAGTCAFEARSCCKHRRATYPSGVRARHCEQCCNTAAAPPTIRTPSMVSLVLRTRRVGRFHIGRRTRGHVR